MVVFHFLLMNPTQVLLSFTAVERNLDFIHLMWKHTFHLAVGSPLRDAGGDACAHKTSFMNAVERWEDHDDGPWHRKRQVQ